MHTQLSELIGQQNNQLQKKVKTIYREGEVQVRKRIKEKLLGKRVRLCNNDELDADLVRLDGQSGTIVKIISSFDKDCQYIDIEFDVEFDNGETLQNLTAYELELIK